MAVVLTVRLEAKPGREDDLRAALVALTRHSRAEHGCVRYLPSEDPRDPAVFFLYEEWADDEALERHRTTPEFRALAGGQLKDALAVSSPSRFRPLPVAD